jgi:sulfur-carrier protein
MTYHILYFAILRDERGVPKEDIQSAAKTPRALYNELQKKHSFTLDAQQLGVAINEDFADWDSALQEGDEVVFIPPVAGG